MDSTDNTMLRIGSMNMLLHGVENPDIRYRDSLSQDHAGEEEKYTSSSRTLLSLGRSTMKTALRTPAVVKTKKTELLFLALFLRLLKPGGRAAVIVPEGVFFGSSNAHKTLREDRRGTETRRRDLLLPSGVSNLRRGFNGHPPFRQDQLRGHGYRVVLRRPS